MLEWCIQYYGADWMAMMMTFMSLYTLGNRLRIGFIFGIMANIFWLIFGLLAGSMASPIANIVFLILNIRGYLEWEKPQIEKKIK